jgi:O-antigen/teichoic acid export membrane protein
MIKQLFKQYQNNQRFRQVLTLYSVNVVMIPLSIVSSIIITRFLGPVGFGDFKFLFNIFNLSVSLFTFGLFQAGNRALVLNNDIQKAREIYGAELVILGTLTLIMAISLLGYAFFDKNIQVKGLRGNLIFLIPFSWVFLLSAYFEVLFPADNKINLLANSRLYPKIGFFILVLIIYLVFIKYAGNKVTLVWIFFLTAQIAVFLYIIHKINPSFQNLRKRISEIWIFNKSFGFNVYMGSVFAVSFSQLTGVMISYFGLDNSGVGYFSLATTIAAPLEFIPNVISTTHYKDFSTGNSIPRKLTLITIALSCCALVSIMVLVGPFIKYFYGPKFYPVISLTYIVCIGVIFNGFADFINRFLGSHGQGKALRNSSIIVGVCLMLFNITLIPRLGETGAACTTALSGLIYVLCMIWFYRRLIVSLKRKI